MKLFENEQLDNLLDQLCEFNLNPVFIVSGDKDLVVYKASAKTERLLSKLKSDFIGLSFLELFPSEVSKSIRSVLRRCKRSQSTEKLQIEFTTPDEDTVFLDIISTYLTVGHAEFFLIQSNNRTKETVMMKEVEQLNQQLSELSKKDELTGLMTRAHFDLLFQKEMEIVKKSQSAAALMLFDIDNFKEYNDLNGHEVGNEAIKEISLLLKESMPVSFIMARYGGEEFVIYCPDKAPSEIHSYAEEFSSTVLGHPFVNRESQPLGYFSVSCGIISFDGDKQAEEVYKQLDDVVQQAKKAGRNKIILDESGIK